MGFDIWFQPAGDAAMPSPDEFGAWFAARPWYLPDEPGRYENEDTGVYFAFDVPVDDDETAEGIYFELYVCKSRVFALEAVAEVRAFVDAFSLQLCDPLPEGLQPGPFTEDAFLATWAALNETGIANWKRTRAMLGDDGPILHLPAERLRDLWQWNLGCRAHRNDTTDAWPVRIVVRDDQAFTAVIRPESLDELKPTTWVPDADYLLVPVPTGKKKHPRHRVVATHDIATGWPMPAKPTDDDGGSVRHRELTPEHLAIDDVLSDPETIEILLPADIFDTDLIA